MLSNRAIKIEQMRGTALIIDTTALRTSKKIEERIWLGGRAVAHVERRGNNWVAMEVAAVLQQSTGTALFVDTATLRPTEKLKKILFSVHFLRSGSLNKTEKIFILGKHVV